MARRFTTRPHILVVDDDPLLLEGLREALLLWGAGRVIPAADGDEAMSVLATEPVDLLLTDWAMAPVGGEALVRWVRTCRTSLRPDLPIAVLTGRAEVGTVRSAWDAGVDTVLAKPVPPELLARRLGVLLDRARGDGEPLERRRPPIACAPAAPPAPRSGAGLPPTVAPDRRATLLRLIDRLDDAADRPGLARLPVLATELRRVVEKNSLVEEIAASLTACVRTVRPGAAGQRDALHAHLAALRWALVEEPSNQSAARLLLRHLSSTVDRLARCAQAPEHAVLAGAVREFP